MREIRINPRNFEEKFKEGLESIIYYYNDKNYYDEQVLYKRFRSIEYIRQYNMNISDNMIKNKYEKILMIPTLNCFKDEIKILDVGEERNKIQGYTMKKSNLRPVTARYINYKTEDNKILNKLVYHSPKRVELSTSDKIKYLKLIKEKIDKLNANDVYIGDFNYENFLVDDDIKHIQLCDLDNLKIWSHDFDNKTASVIKYENECMKEDKNLNIEGLDSFCFNIFTLSLLTNESNFYTLKTIKTLELPEILDEYPNREIMDSIKHLDKTYKPRYLIDIFK